MLLVKCPLRLSFFGGGSDIPAHFREHGGATLSATFDKYVYVAMMRSVQPHIKVAYSTTEYATNVQDIKHDIVREALKYYNVTSHIEITSFADIPTVGTGLGASSAFAVSLAAGFWSQVDDAWTPRDLYTDAKIIELGMVKSPIGVQDHVAAAFGGMLYTNYGGPGEIAVTRIHPPVYRTLAPRLLLVKMPQRSVSANEILKTPMSPSEVSRLADMARDARWLLESGDITSFGALLHDSWMIKRSLHPHISTPEIDTAYTAGRSFGLLGGKLLGAGNGGYLLMCAESPEQRTRAMATVYRDYECHAVNIDDQGVRIAFAD